MLWTRTFHICIAYGSMQQCMIILRTIWECGMRVRNGNCLDWWLALVYVCLSWVGRCARHTVGLPMPSIISAHVHRNDQLPYVHTPITITSTNEPISSAPTYTDLLPAFINILLVSRWSRVGTIDTRRYVHFAYCVNKICSRWMMIGFVIMLLHKETIRCQSVLTATEAPTSRNRNC